MTTSVRPSSTYEAVAQPRNGMGVAALCCGIAGILLGLVPFMFFATGALAACAIVFGATGIHRAARHEATNRGMAVAGLIAGVIAALVALWGTAIVFGGLHALSDDLGRVQSDTGAHAVRLPNDQRIAAHDAQRLIREGEFIGNLSAPPSPVTPPTPVTIWPKTSPERPGALPPALMR